MPAVSDEKLIGELYAAGQTQEVLRTASKVIAQRPADGELLKIYGASLAREGDTRRAINALGRSLALAPSDKETVWNLACLFDECKDRFAINLYLRYICTDPTDSTGYAALAHSAFQSGQYVFGVLHADYALRMVPGDWCVRLTKGVALKKLHRFSAAEFEFRTAASLNSQSSAALFNLGSILLDRGACEEASRLLIQAITIDPGFFGAYLHAGRSAHKLKHSRKASRMYRRAVQIDPEYEYLLGTCLELDLNECYWRYAEDDKREILRRLVVGQKSAASLTVLAVTDDPELQLCAARTFAVSQRLESDVEFQAVNNGSGKIRIGYFSADFRNHPTSHLIAGLLASHDRTRFEVFAFQIHPVVRDWMTDRIRNAVDHYVDVSDLNDGEVVARCRELKIDIAVDLMGYTEHCRTEIYARRCAPLQINYLGYMGSMGVPFMDYLIADEKIVNKKNREFIDEKVIFMPDCFQVNSDRKISTEIRPDRRSIGIPQDAFVYCCFNSAYKINPVMFSIWMKVLLAVPGSVLWLVSSSREARHYLRQEAALLGVSSSRIIFTERVSHGRYLSQFTVADLFLDTFPYNGGATSSDALWAGLPVLTLSGQSIVSRMGASLLEALGVSELIARDSEEYFSAAVTLGRHHDRLAAIRHRVTTRRSSSSLFNLPRFVAHYESAMESIHKIRRDGADPVDLVVAAISHC